MIFLKSYFVNTTSNVDVVSIIHEVNRAVRESNIPDGLVTVSAPGPGAAVTIIEPLPDIVAGLKNTLQAFSGGLADTKNRRKEEIEIRPRVLAAMIGKSVQLPAKAGKLVIGPREEIVIVDMEKGGLRREFYVQVMGDAPQQAQQPQRGAPPRRK